MARCDVCFRHCDITEGGMGFCGVRTCRNGVISAANYGKVTALALDPIEKKPLNRFHPGSRILSVGSYGCNLRCPFCQNDDISWSERAYGYADKAEYLSPEELVAIALDCKDRGNIGIAYTYNEPLVGYEYVLDTAVTAHEAGLVNVMVTNGTADIVILERLSPFIDAMNIDLKGYTDRYYKDVLNGDLSQVKDFIEYAASFCHVELTTLIIPGENDTDEEMRDITDFIAGITSVHGGMSGEDIPLHISRFFPQYKMTDRPATDVSLIYHLADVAKERLHYVYTGNC